MRLFAHSCGFLPTHAAFWWRQQLWKERPDDNDPHIKVVELFTPETLTAFVCGSEMNSVSICLAERLPNGVVSFLGAERLVGIEKGLVDSGDHWRLD